MPTLPNPFTDSALEPAMAADIGRCPGLTDPPVAAAEPIHDPAMETGGPEEAPAARGIEPPVAVGATDCIGEIFHHARKLCAEAREEPSTFILDEPRFMAELADELMRQELIMPSFLRAPSQAYLRAIA